MPKTPTDYSKTSIYKIQSIDNPELLYVGSTTDFTKRKNRHKSRCNKPNDKGYNLKLYKMMRDNGGWDMFNMVIVKEFPCENKRQAEAEEDRIIRETKSNMNMRRAYVSHDELLEQKKKYREQNIERMKQYYEQNKEYYKQYREQNKEQIAERNKQYYEQNKEQIVERKKQYYEQNKEQIVEQHKQYGKQKITCDCGCIIRRDSMIKHKRSKKHQDLMN